MCVVCVLTDSDRFRHSYTVCFYGESMTFTPEGDARDVEVISVQLLYCIGKKISSKVSTL